MFVKLIKIVATFGMTVSTLAAADQMDNLRNCRFSCSQFCLNQADNLRNIIDDIDASCGGGVIHPIPQGPSIYVTADGRKIVYARPGQQIHYEWRSLNAIRASSYYTAIGNPSCAVGQGPWVVNTVAGSTIGITAQRQAGCSYTATIVVSDQYNRTAQDSVTVVVTN